MLKTTALIMVLTGSLVAPCVWAQDDFGDDESLQADDQSNDEAEESEGDTDAVDDSATDEASADESGDMAPAEDSDDQSNGEAEESDGDTETDESADETDVDDSTADEAPPPPPPPPPPPAPERVAATPAPASSSNLNWTLELAVYLEDAPWPATRDELIDFAQRNGAPLEVAENLGNLPDGGMEYENIEKIWPDYPNKVDSLFKEDE